MHLMTMRFKDFTWRDNPTALRVSCERGLAEAAAPFGESLARDLGPRQRKVTGEGAFAGEDAMEQWGRLSALFAAGGPGLLQLPGVEPLWALLDRLELIGAQGRDLVRYAFSFTEEAGRRPYAGRGRYRAQAGETLWDYARRWGRTVEELAAANPWVRDICQLEEGEEVLVP